MDKSNDVALNVITYGVVGEYIMGSFSCLDADSEVDNESGTVVITKGFFKVLRLADDVVHFAE